jgi:adenylate kinase family enzyme
MRRILLIGSGGAGKSTMATRLGAMLGLPVIHLDAHYWRAGWVATPADEWRAHVADLASGDAWIMDGNYGGTMEQRLAACDTVIFLDLPRTVCLWRILRRTIRFAGRSRPDMTPGCPERLTWEFAWWVWTYPTRRRPGVLQRLAALPATTRVLRLRSARDVERLLTAGEQHFTTGVTGGASPDSSVQNQRTIIE